MLHVILDSNIIIADYLMRGSKFQSLFNFLGSTGARLIVPRAVRSEVLKHFSLKCKSAKRSLGSLNSEHLTAIACEELIDVAALRDAINERERLYDGAMQKTLRGTNFFDIDEEAPQLADLIDRAVNRRKPLKQNGTGLGDLLIWYAVRRCVMTYGDVAFVSGNHKDFADQYDRSRLHPELLKEVEDSKFKLSYYGGIHDFLSDIVEKPKGVDVPYLEELESFEAVKNSVLEVAKDSAELIRHALPQPVFGTIEIARRSTKLDSFYVYRKGTGKLALDTRFLVDVAFHVGMVSGYMIDVESTAQLQIDANCELEDGVIRFVGVLSKRLGAIQYKPCSPELHGITFGSSAGVEWLTPSGIINVSGSIDELQGVSLYGGTNASFVDSPQSYRGWTFLGATPGIGTPAGSSSDRRNRNRTDDVDPSDDSSTDSNRETGPGGDGED